MGWVDESNGERRLDGRSAWVKDGDRDRRESGVPDRVG